MSQEVELAIFRALGAAGVALPGNQVSAIAETVLEVALTSARSEVSQAVAAEIVGDRARERAAAAEAIKAARAEAADAIEAVRTEAEQALAATKAQIPPPLTDKTLIRRLNAADSKVMRRDKKIRELRRDLQNAKQSQPSREDVFNEVYLRAHDLMFGRETAGIFGGREVVSAHRIDEFIAWLEAERFIEFDGSAHLPGDET